VIAQAAVLESTGERTGERYVEPAECRQPEAEHTPTLTPTRALGSGRHNCPRAEFFYQLTGEGRTEREIAKFSAKNATSYPAYQAEIRRVADALRSVLLIAPPNLGGTPPGAHVASLFCQDVSSQFADGSTWDQHRETVARRFL
jgi:hypothetical protein